MKRRFRQSPVAENILTGAEQPESEKIRTVTACAEAAKARASKVVLIILRIGDGIAKRNMWRVSGEVARRIHRQAAQAQEATLQAPIVANADEYNATTKHSSRGTMLEAG